MSPERAAERPVFEYVDAVEVCNGRLTDGENEIAQKVGAYLGLPGLGGSDAHRLDEIGHCVTVFENAINDDRELIEALRSGRCQPVVAIPSSARAR
jgi:hypothetical protein